MIDDHGRGSIGGNSDNCRAGAKSGESARMWPRPTTPTPQKRCLSLAMLATGAARVGRTLFAPTPRPFTNLPHAPAIDVAHGPRLGDREWTEVARHFMSGRNRTKKPCPTRKGL